MSSYDTANNGAGVSLGRAVLSVAPRDAYDLSPSPKALFTAFGKHAPSVAFPVTKHTTTDERSESVAAIQRLSTAFLRSALYAGDSPWREAVATLAAEMAPEGSIEAK
ncbi:hypothetical protein [Sphingomonas endolithica]|uniref:hypothetical protein n=1 Tax=Sphingomonas endolithica TaxID=2972485 RepID=UPI0021B02DE6|nr:hypothetical protein [Sphingomonas sp. ZFBP2030]